MLTDRRTVLGGIAATGFVAACSETRGDQPAAAPIGFQAHNVEVIAYHDLDRRPGFKLTMLERNGRWYLYTGCFWHRGWNVLDVTDPARPEMVNFLEGPANTFTLQVDLADNKGGDRYASMGSVQYALTMRREVNFRQPDHAFMPDTPEERRQSNEVLVAEPYSRFDHTFGSDPESVVSWRLEPDGDGTRLILIHRVPEAWADARKDDGCGRRGLALGGRRRRIGPRDRRHVERLTRAQFDHVDATVCRHHEIGRDVWPRGFDEDMDPARQAGAAFGVADDPARRIASRNRPGPGQALSGLERDVGDLPG